METVILLVFLSWLIWGIARGIFTLSVIFLLTPEFCKFNSISFTLKHPIETMFRWTMLFITVLLFLVKPYVFSIVTILPILFAISVSISLRRKFFIKNNTSKTESSNDD